MISRDVLNALAQNGRLIRHHPNLDRDAVERRRIYVVPDLHRRLVDRDMAAVRSHLKQFVVGAPLSGTDFIARLKPDPAGIWEFRIQLVPEHRVFGAFAQKDCFVACLLRDRAALKARKGEDRNAKFAAAIRDVQTEWSAPFGTLRPLQNLEFNEFMTPKFEINDHAE